MQKRTLWTPLAVLALSLCACEDSSSGSSSNEGAGSGGGFADAACSKALTEMEARTLLGVKEALDLTDTIRFKGLSNEQHHCSYNQYIVPEGKYFGEYNSLDWTFGITTLKNMRGSYTAYTAVKTIGDKHCVKTSSLGTELFFLYQDHGISSSVDAMRLWTADKSCVPDSAVPMQLYVNCQNTDFVASIDPVPAMDSLELLDAYDGLATKICAQ